MKLSNLESNKLIPKFADYYNFACKAFDEFINTTQGRAVSLSAPWTLDGIANLTENELIEYYNIYSKIPYFPDLPRENRNMILFNQMKNLRKGITREVLKEIFEYINVTPLFLSDIEDTLAFDENGDLEDEDYLHLYNIEFYELTGNLSAITIERIIAALKEFMRASAKLNMIKFNSILDGDYGAWGIALWGADIPTPYTNTTIALRGASTELGYTWGLAQAKRCVDAATASPSAPYPCTPLDASVGETQYVFFSKADAKYFVRRVYAVKSSGVYRATSGTVGIYRVAPTPVEFEKMYREV